MNLFLKELIINKKALDKKTNSLYNTNGLNLIFVWRDPIKTYESCQVRKEAAISRYLYVESFHREIEYRPFFIVRGCEKNGVHSSLSKI